MFEDLDSLIEKKRFELAQLERAKEALSQVEGVFQQGGVVRKPVKKKVPKRTDGTSETPKKKKKGGRPKGTTGNKKGSREYAMEVLAKHPEGLSLTDLADRVLKAGYQTNSNNFSQSLYQVLYNDRKKGKNFDVDEQSGKWKLVESE